MNDKGGDGAGCFDIKEWVDTTELTNVEVAGLGKCSYLVGKSKVFIEDEAMQVASRVGGTERAVLYFGKLLFESDEKKFSFRSGVES